MARSSYQRLDTLWDEEIEPDIRKFQVQVAREVLAEEQARGFDRTPRRIVDRRFDAPLESVREFGVIEFASRTDILEAARWIAGELARRAPVLTGRYRRSQFVLINGTQSTLDAYKPGDRIQFVDTQPYAKKIEGRPKSKTGGAAVRGQSKQAPNGVYRAVFAAARRRFSKSLFIDFAYRKLNTGVTVMGYQGGAHYTATRSGGDIRRRKRIRRPMVYPVINLYQTAAGAAGSSP